MLVHGVEISTLCGDFLVYSPDLDYLAGFKDVQAVPPAATIADHAAVVWAHPGAGGGRSGSIYYPGLAEQVAMLIDAVEVACRPPAAATPIGSNASAAAPPR